MPKGFVTHPLDNMPAYNVDTTSRILQKYFLSVEEWQKDIIGSATSNPFADGEVPMGFSYQTFLKETFNQMQAVDKYKVLPNQQPRPKYKKMKHYYTGTYKNWKSLFYILNRMGVIEPHRKGFQLTIEYAEDDMHHAMAVRYAQEGGQPVMRDWLSRGLKQASTYHITDYDPVSPDVMQALREILPPASQQDIGYNTVWESPYDVFTALNKYSMLPEKKKIEPIKLPAFLNRTNDDLIGTVYNGLVRNSAMSLRDILNVPKGWDYYTSRMDITFRQKQVYVAQLPKRNFYIYNLLFLKQPKV